MTLLSPGEELGPETESSIFISPIWRFVGRYNWVLSKVIRMITGYNLSLPTYLQPYFYITTHIPNPQTLNVNPKPKTQNPKP